MAQLTTENDNSATFVPADGLAGDVNAVNADIAGRNTCISHLERQLELFDAHHAKEEQDINAASINDQNRLERQIKSLQNQLAVTKRQRLRDIAKLSEKHGILRNPVHQRISELRTQNSHDRCRIAPIRKLPAEVLSDIFCEFVEINGSPLLLTKVSNRWQRTAINTPLLWTHISFMSALPTIPIPCEYRVIGDQKIFSRGKQLMCHDVDSFLLLVGLSRVHPLHIELVLYNIDDGIPALRAVFSEASVSNRIKSVDINDRGIDAYGQVHVGPLRMLQKLTHTSVCPTLSQTIFDTMMATSCRPLQITLKHRVILPWDRIFWKGIQALDLGGSSTPHQLNSVISHMTRIQDLCGCPNGWPNESTEEVELPMLSALHVTCNAKYMHLLRLPALQQLHLCDLARDEQMSPITLPALTTLEIASKDPSRWLRGLNAPVLSVLRLRRVDGVVPDFGNFTGRPFLAVVEFDLDAWCPGGVVISALRRVPNAERVLVAAGANATKAEPHWAVDTLKALANEENILCPRMTHLTLGTASKRLTLGASVADPLVKKLIDSRAMMGTELQHFLILAKRRGKDVELQYA